MIPEAQVIWNGLEFRKPMLMRQVDPLTDAQLTWRPGPDRNSIAWQLWHIAEVEDNWIAAVRGDAMNFPFVLELREAKDDQFPSKDELLDYFNAVRARTRSRLEALSASDLDEKFDDPDFGQCTLRDLWMGVVTSFAWHAGQIALTAKLMPESPIDVLKFSKWKDRLL